MKLRVKNCELRMKRIIAIFSIIFSFFMISACGDDPLIFYKYFQNDEIYVIPNPSSNYVNLQFSLRRHAKTKAIITDSDGRYILTLVDDLLPSGGIEIRIDNPKLAPGAYVAIVQAEDEILSKRFVVIK